MYNYMSIILGNTTPRVWYNSWSIFSPPNGKFNAFRPNLEDHLSFSLLAMFETPCTLYSLLFTFINLVELVDFVCFMQICDWNKIYYWIFNTLSLDLMLEPLNVLKLAGKLAHMCTYGPMLAHMNTCTCNNTYTHAHACLNRWDGRGWAGLTIIRAKKELIECHGSNGFTYCFLCVVIYKNGSLSGLI